MTGTDTDIGKTFIAAGLAHAIRNRGIDIGIMKPFAAGAAQKNGFKSEDAEILARAAESGDSEDMVNPQFFPVFASPYTAWKNLKTRPNTRHVLSCFKRLQKRHEMVLVEGAGGLMTPILKDYFVADLIREMSIPAVVITKSRIGAINHTVMTCHMCKEYDIPVRGIIINCLGGGYSPEELARDLHDLTGVKILGTVPPIKNNSSQKIIKDSINIDELLS